MTALPAPDIGKDQLAVLRRDALPEFGGGRGELGDGFEGHFLASRVLHRRKYRRLRGRDMGGASQVFRISEFRHPWGSREAQQFSAFRQFGVPQREAENLKSWKAETWGCGFNLPCSILELLFGLRGFRYPCVPAILTPTLKLAYTPFPDHHYLPVIFRAILMTSNTLAKSVPAFATVQSTSVHNKSLFLTFLLADCFFTGIYYFVWFGGSRGELHHA